MTTQPTIRRDASAGPRRSLALVLLLVLLAGCRGSRPVPAPARATPPITTTGAAPTLVPVAAAPTSPTAHPTASATRTPIAPGASPAPRPSATPGGPILHQTHNILVMGMDHRPSDPNPAWNTDTLMVVAIDSAHERVGVVSIPRDLYVDIPTLGKTRINTADYYGESRGYPGGGPALVRRVLTETFDLPTQDYVRVQWDALPKLVDTLGGITVTLDCPLYERTPDKYSPNGVVDWNLPAGQVFLNGANAKKFATYRYVTTDFGRTQRQQQVIWAIRNRALQLNVLPRLPTLYAALKDSYTTDLGLGSILELARLGARLKPESVHGLVFGTDVLDYGWTDEGASVLVIKDRAKMMEQLGRLFDNPPLATLGQSSKGSAKTCPPPPTAVPTFAPPTLTATATATVTATAPVTGTLSVPLGAPSAPDQGAGQTPSPPAPETPATAPVPATPVAAPPPEATPAPAPG